MAPGDRVTVIVTVLEGRNFLKRPNGSYFVQCRFNNEILTSDPTPAIPSPTFDTELSWVLPSKLLHLLRSQREVVKLVCYALDDRGRRDSVGYVVLDLRTGKDLPGDERWYPLLGATKGSGGVFRPEIKMSFGIGWTGEEDHHSQAANSVDEVENDQLDENFSPSASEHKASSAAEGPNFMRRSPDDSHEAPKDRLQGAANDEERHRRKSSSSSSNASPLSPRESSPVSRYQTHAAPLSPSGAVLTATAPSTRPVSHQIPVRLGEAGYYQIGQGSHNYRLSITISLARNLNSLVDVASREWPGEAARGWASGFYFYYSFLGNDIVSDKFSDASNPNFTAERVSIAIRSSWEEICSFIRETKRLIVYLYHETRVLGSADIPLTALLEDAAEADDGARGIDGLYPMSNIRHAIISEPERGPGVGVSITLDEGDGTAHVLPEVVREAQNLQNIPVSSIGATDPLRGNPFARSPSPPTGDRVANPPADAPALPNGDHIVAASVQPWTQYRLSIDIRTIRHTPANRHVVFRYSYPALGTAGRVISGVAEVPPSGSKSTRSPEVRVPNGYVAFEFVMADHQLRTYLEALPLIIEAWGKDAEGRDKDVKLGEAEVRMGGLYSARETRESLEDGRTIGLRTWDGWIPITAEAREGSSLKGKREGEVRIVLGLEDFGAVGQYDEAVAEQNEDAGQLQNGSPARNVSQSRTPGRNQSGRGGAQRAASPASSDRIHATAEYRAVQELEQWKRAEEARFVEHLRSRESELLSKLTEEWRKRNRDRDDALRRKIEEFVRLESQVAQMLATLEEREQKIIQAEVDVRAREAEVRWSEERAQKAMREQVTRMEGESRSLLELQQRKTADAEDRARRAEVERDREREMRVRVETEVAEIRKASSSAPESALRGQLVQVAADRDRLMRRLESEQAKRAAYKARWVGALKELAKMKRRWADEVEEGLKAATRELEVAKARAAKEDAVGAAGDRDALTQIKRELEEMRAKVERAGKAPRRKRSQGASRDTGYSSDNSDEGIASDQYDSTTELSGGVRSASRRARNDGHSNQIGSGTANSRGTDLLMGDLSKLNPKLRAEVERLRLERDGLLKTGLYTRNDALVVELEARMRQLVMA
ncbi:hypothetical protein M427DRAFT_72154 [Gonapodya prolifera JEL478]|uniref:C2 domain-containing protein n=1 Tax=Gonapodya prolifera (strain JEL478) TaxID=1344416 RepID=A0A139A675_GONPJ|nr:hypothetical protein M427DRAFT_72154 [Gonapodya prolifera JEL478]|eukprot:KXS12158.1 hypothetical protein M427DRAFT_72154 [Gonapodya prolifera JEL478]